jgi:hypothetical protein
LRASGDGRRDRLGGWGGSVVGSKSRAEIKVQSSKFKVQSSKFKVQSAKCKVQSAKHKCGCRRGVTGEPGLSEWNGGAVGGARGAPGLHERSFMSAATGIPRNCGSTRISAATDVYCRENM